MSVFKLKSIKSVVKARKDFEKLCGMPMKILA